MWSPHRGGRSGRFDFIMKLDVTFYFLLLSIDLNH